MLRRLQRLASRSRTDERGVEAIAMLIVIPVLSVLIFALIDIGLMVQTRMSVENIVRDTVRSAAADGGNFNPRTNTVGNRWDRVALNRLYRNGACTQSACTGVPTLTCTTVSLQSGGVIYSNVARHAGDLITCKGRYPYKPINGSLLNGPLGLGFGSMLGPFDIEMTARAETGTLG